MPKTKDQKKAHLALPDGKAEPSSSGDLSKVPEVFARALRAQGFTELTEIQEAVLSPELQGRDLRISSQTGSGKTVALGFVVGAPFLDGGSDVDHEDRRSGPAKPKVLLIAPTRELAAQLGKELSWLYGGLHLGIAVVTGGTPIGGDLRALSTRPEVVVGTPGRLVDHLTRGSMAMFDLQAVVLDEADEMLDMGFRDELRAILDKTPKDRSTHMVSATFSPKVKQLADTYQNNAVLVEGKVGTNHQDISHFAMLVEGRNRIDALVNLLLLHPDQRVLVFVRTRVASSGVAGELSALGFKVSALSGEMGQNERARCVADFRARRLQCVIATDVAARGIDIRGVQKIVHYDLPDSTEAFTHRSGRTGRAGDKGESILFVAPHSRRRAEQLFKVTKTEASWRTVPTPAQVRKASRKRLLRKYGGVSADVESPGIESAAGEIAAGEIAAGEIAAGEIAETATKTTVKTSAATVAAQPAMLELAEALLKRRPAIELVADLLEGVGVEGPVKPRSIPEIGQRGSHTGPSAERRPKAKGFQDGPRAPRGESRDRRDAGRFVPFHVSWGTKGGANTQRLLAHVCQRGGLDGSKVGSIEVHDHRAVVDIAVDVAESFERTAAKPDPRNPRVFIQKFVPFDQRRKNKKK